MSQRRPDKQTWHRTTPPRRCRMLPCAALCHAPSGARATETPLYALGRLTAVAALLRVGYRPLRPTESTPPRTRGRVESLTYRQLKTASEMIGMEVQSCEVRSEVTPPPQFNWVFEHSPEQLGRQDEAQSVAHPPAARPLDYSLHFRSRRDRCDHRKAAGHEVHQFRWHVEVGALVALGDEGDCCPAEVVPEDVLGHDAGDIDAVRSDSCSNLVARRVRRPRLTAERRARPATRTLQRPRHALEALARILRCPLQERGPRRSRHRYDSRRAHALPGYRFV